MRKLIFLLLLSYITPVDAFELFGVTLNNINRTQLREAINNSGAEVVREAGDDNWFDIYKLNAVFEQSRQLYVGYNKQNGSFAFAEYDLPYHYLPTMLQRLRAKYGAPVILYGTFASDRRYRWNQDGIVIELSYDWHNNRSRLLYQQQANLTALQQAYQQDLDTKRQQKLNIDVTYF